ncbi:MAG: coenzyme F420-0:L-glutamate ligase [Chloroflexota bacterium]|nr:MAG: coenzyme F420-0:L-glutamate ligase [Chloroflexota bacterium]
MIQLLPVRALPLIERGASLADLILDALRTVGESLQQADIVIVAQKIVSKAEGRIVTVDDIVPSARARELAAETGKDPRLVELILRESREVIRAAPGVLIVEDNRGFVCANAGIDRSNVQQEGPGEQVALLPLDPDASATSLMNDFRRLTGMEIPVVVNDSHGRAWRDGTVGVAIGVAGMLATWDRRGDTDLTGYTLEHTILGIADEVAAAASLLMGPASEGVPVVIVRGAQLPRGVGRAKDIQRPRQRDLFR